MTEVALSQAAEVAAFVNEMKKTYPVYTTGDFNNNEHTKVFKTYLESADIVDAMYAAEKRLNVAGSWHDWGKNTASSGSCDHITATKDSTVLKFETAMYNEQIWASDHAWLIADIKFNN
jgi:endonuclease/exonuclease/phosphatase family metal-dependent hydrolase